MNLKKLKNLLKSHDNVTFTKSEDEKTSFSVQFPAKEVLKTVEKLEKELTDVRLNHILTRL